MDKVSLRNSKCGRRQLTHFVGSDICTHYPCCHWKPRSCWVISLLTVFPLLPISLGWHGVILPTYFPSPLFFLPLLTWSSKTQHRWVPCRRSLNLLVFPVLVNGTPSTWNVFPLPMPQDSNQTSFGKPPTPPRRVKPGSSEVLQNIAFSLN